MMMPRRFHGPEGDEVANALEESTDALRRCAEEMPLIAGDADAVKSWARYLGWHADRLRAIQRDIVGETTTELARFHHERGDMSAPSAVTRGPRLPDVRVRLDDANGNILKAVRDAIRSAGYVAAAERFSRYALAAKSYDDMLARIKLWVVVE